MDRTHSFRLSRLHRDLTELLENPYPGVSVFLDDANIRKSCLVLTPPSGPWKDLALHFDVVLPDNWPSSPPRISCTVPGIQHPNLFRSYICCDLLKSQDGLEKGYTGGYTPALTLRGLFLQFLTFFSSRKVEQADGGFVDIGEAHEISYVRECDLEARLFPKDNCCRNRHPCHCKSTASSRRELELEWEADQSPIETLDSFFKIVHQVKGKQGDGRRMHCFKRPNPVWEKTYSLISQFHCPSCPYGSDDLPHLKSTSLAPDEATVPSPPLGSKCSLSLLNDDVLSEIAEHLTSESLISFGKAYHRMHDVIRSMHILVRRELVCFYLRTPIQDSILGIGVAMDRGARTLSSDFDWLSYEAFNNHGVRRSIQKRSFEFFLPLALNRRHFIRAYNYMWPALNKIDHAVRQAERATNRRNGRAENSESPIHPHQAIRVLYKMLNSIVVSLMKSCDDVLQAPAGNARPSQTTLLYASEKAVISYCHIFHLILCLCRTHSVILRDAMDLLERFKDHSTSRVKQVVPDLGELIVMIILVSALPPKGRERMDWPMISGPVLEELLIRNARWVLQKSPELEKMEQGVSSYRLNVTFENSKTGLRLMMFQITFLDTFTRVYGGTAVSRLDDNYGFAEAGIAKELVEEIKGIYRVKTWPDFFKRIRFEKGRTYTQAEFCDMLRAAVKTSAQRGYHSQGEFRGRKVV